MNVPTKPIKCEITKAMLKGAEEGTDLCLMCKGSRLLCGRNYCPLLQRVARVTSPKTNERLGQEMFGPSPPSIFVGRFNYPNVAVGPMSAIDPENPALADDPSKWYGLDFDDIIGLRMNLVRSRTRQNVYGRTKVIEDNQELALAVKPADVEVTFKNKPRFNVSFSNVAQPMGPTGVLEKFKIVDNTKIPRKVDSLVHDEVLSRDACETLFDKGYDVYYLSKILSSGALGLEKNKKLVPTRWSITAVDDMLAKKLMTDLREYPELNEFRVYSNTYLDNHFEILLMPGGWEFEQFEAWAPQTLWTLGMQKPVIQVEGEPHEGRSDYADKEGGGYYASRLAVAEGMHRLKRQARAVVFREIYEGYVVPVGVWEVRENVRKAFERKPERFQTKKEALAHVASRLKIPFRDYLRMSTILRQRRLRDF